MIDYIPTPGPHEGKQFEPSNGTEGTAFIDQWCSNCARDDELSGTAFQEGREPDEDKLCPIVAASFRGEAVEWRELPDGQVKCIAFVPLGQRVPAPRCVHTQDLFA